MVWESDLPPRLTSVMKQVNQRHTTNGMLPNGYVITDKWGDDWVLTNGEFVVDGWYIVGKP